jgi:hypothetical protein
LKQAAESVLACLTIGQDSLNTSSMEFLLSSQIPTEGELYVKITVEGDSRILELGYKELDIWAKYFKEALEEFDFKNSNDVQKLLIFSLENIASFWGLEDEPNWEFDQIRFILK